MPRCMNVSRPVTRSSSGFSAPATDTTTTTSSSAARSDSTKSVEVAPDAAPASGDGGDEDAGEKDKSPPGTPPRTPQADDKDDDNDGDEKGEREADVYFPLTQTPVSPTQFFLRRTESDLVGSQDTTVDLFDLAKDFSAPSPPAPPAGPKTPSKEERDSTPLTPSSSATSSTSILGAPAVAKKRSVFEASSDGEVLPLVSKRARALFTSARSLADTPTPTKPVRIAKEPKGGPTSPQRAVSPEVDEFALTQVV